MRVLLGGVVYLVRSEIFVGLKFAVIGAICSVQYYGLWVVVLRRILRLGKQLRVSYEVFKDGLCLIRCFRVVILQTFKG